MSLPGPTSRSAPATRASPSAFSRPAPIASASSRALDRGSHSPLRFPPVALFAVAGVLLALATMVLVIAQS
jgi:hypothetical protein